MERVQHVLGAGKGREETEENTQCKKAAVQLTRICDLYLQRYYLGGKLIKNENVDHCHDYVFINAVLTFLGDLFTLTP